MKSLVLFFLAAALTHAAPRIENHTLLLDSAFTFVGNTAELAPASDAAAQQLAGYLREKTTFTRVRIEGHVAGPHTAARQELSEARARAVVAKLIALGVECARLLPVGFGSTKPTATPIGAAANTRIEVKPAALRGRAIGGLPEDGGGVVAGNPCAP